MKRIRLSLLEDVYLLLTFALDCAVLAVVLAFALRGWDASAYDEFYFVAGYAAAFGALDLAGLALYHALAFAFCELHLCLFALRMSFALALCVNSAVGLYGLLTLQGRMGAVRPQYQVFWLLAFFLGAVLNALLVRSLLARLRPSARAAAARAPNAIRSVF